jgi:hypothetical protein
LREEESSNWHQIANAIQNETDSGKLSELVSELCDAIDFERKTTNDFNSHSGAQIEPERESNASTTGCHDEVA